MSVLPIRLFGEPILREKSKRVTDLDGSIQKLIDDMIETMQAESGAGLAAPQVGVSLRVITIKMPGMEAFALINPEVVKKEGVRDVTEGCLSFPGYQAEIKRAIRVTAKGQDHRGKKIRLKAEKLLAQALEHETDHLNGVLYIDHLESPNKLYRVEQPVAERI